MFDSELAYFRSTITRDHGDAIIQGLGLPEGAISDIVRKGPFQNLDESAINSIIRELETSFTVTQKRGAVITKDHRPWLAAKRSQIDFYYWNRLRKYYQRDGSAVRSSSPEERSCRHHQLSTPGECHVRSGG